ncbi:DUF2125 domain-containing protein [Rhodobacteraceae bacterium F11138]|nr:DUF2125 domain-containing protein [Rhodobacteraceae bacterium F11138]
MSKFFARSAGAALAYTIATQAAYADLTAQQVWSDLQSYLASAGYSVTGDEQQTGNGVNIQNLALSMALPEDDGVFSVSMDSLAFTENGDGSISIVMPDSIPMAFSGSDAGEDAVSGVITYTQSGSDLTATGTTEDINYVYGADRIALNLTSLVVEGETVPSDLARVAVQADKIASNTRMQIDDMRNYEQNLRADALTFDFAFADPESEDRASLKGALQDVAFDSSGKIPMQMDPSDFNQMLADGFVIDGTLRYGAGSSDIEGTGDGTQFAMASASQGGQLSVQMDATRIAYDVEQQQTALTMTGDELPFPLAVNAAVAAFNIAIPVAKSDAEQDFAAGLTLSDFTMSDMLWAMFDPAAQLPRDPATLALDLTGKARVLFNFLDPAVAASLETSGETPLELNALTINKLLISMVGAKLAGTGDFTFDNSDTETFDGMPRPTGHIDLELVGSNALLDKLIAMGLVGDEEAMGARMMMGMLAVPGSEPDTLNSKLEINAQGHVLANGQRIK